LSAPKTDIENSIVVKDYVAMDRILREEKKYIAGLIKKILASGATCLLI
jgi:T-complex protein 1 subunit delta